MLFVLLAFSFTSFGCANPLQETHHNPPAPEIEDDTDETESGNKGSSDKEDENNSESGNGDNGDEDSESETEGGDENEPDPDGEGGPETGNNGEDNSASGDTESEDGGDQNIEDEKPVEENYPEITGFTFTPPQTKIRYSHAVKGRQAGLVGDPVGGTAPFTYSLVSGVNQDISHNDQFAFDGTVLKIQDYGLSIGEYRITIGVTDVHGKTFGKTVTVTVHPDPVLGERKVHEINGIRFAIRYVNQGTYIKDGMQGSVGQVDRGFWMAETETTRELFKAVMGFDPSNSRPRPIPGINDNHKPVDGVTYSEAVVFANRLSLLTGREPVYQTYGINDWLNIPEWAIETIGNSYIAKSNEADGYRLPTEY
jgi:hypothetical protein